MLEAVHSSASPRRARLYLILLSAVLAMSTVPILNSFCPGG